MARTAGGAGRCSQDRSGLATIALRRPHNPRLWCSLSHLADGLTQRWPLRSRRVGILFSRRGDIRAWAWPVRAAVRRRRSHGGEARCGVGVALTEFMAQPASPSTVPSSKRATIKAGQPRNANALIACSLTRRIAGSRENNYRRPPAAAGRQRRGDRGDRLIVGLRRRQQIVAMAHEQAIFRRPHVGGNPTAGPGRDSSASDRAPAADLDHRPMARSGRPPQRSSRCRYAGNASWTASKPPRSRMDGPGPLLAHDSTYAHRAHVVPTSVVDKTVRARQAAVTDRRRWCGRGTRTPTGLSALRIFVPATAFAALACRADAEGASLWSGLSLHRAPAEPEVRCCPSSLYTFPSRARARAWLGIAIKVSPSLGSSASGVSPGALKSPQVRCVYRFRHARVTELLYRWEPSGGYSIFQAGQHLDSQNSHAASARIRRNDENSKRKIEEVAERVRPAPRGQWRVLVRRVRWHHRGPAPDQGPMDANTSGHDDLPRCHGIAAASR